MEVSTQEDSWFSKNEQELIAQAKRRLDQEKKEVASDKDEEVKKLHWMKCPKCGQDMEEVIMENIEVDKCKSCEGIYFDAGELAELLLAENNKKKTIFTKLFS